MIQLGMAGRRKIIALVISVLACIAIGVSGYLTWVTWQSGTVAGCTAESLMDCDSVLASHWSKWFGLPVSLLGMLTYLAILSLVWPAALRPRGLAVLGLFALGLLVAGAGIWFVGLQVVQLQSFCFYCLTVHACGFLIAISALLLFLDSTGSDEYQPMQALFAAPDAPLVAMESTPEEINIPHLFGALAISTVGLAVLMVGQFLSPDTDTAPMEEMDLQSLVDENTSEDDGYVIATDQSIDDEPDKTSVNTESESSADTNESVAESPAEDDEDSLFSSSRRRLKYQGLLNSVEVTDMPILGDPQAEFVLVELMDYTCKHCRHLHPHLRAARERYGDQLAIVIRHVPLSKQCNRNVQKDYPGKKYACDYARLAIGVWKLAPEKFAAFHDWLLEGEKPPNIAEAKKRAMKLVGPAVLTDKKMKAEITRRLLQQSDDLARLRSGLPVLLYQEGAMRGVPEKSEKLFEFLEGRLPGLKPSGF